MTTYSAAFQEIMKRYSALCPSSEVDATDSNEITQIVQRGSDYTFVTENLARKPTGSSSSWGTRPTSGSGPR